MNKCAGVVTQNILILRGEQNEKSCDIILVTFFGDVITMTS